MDTIGVHCFRFAIAVMAVGMSTSSAHAYLDPGTGSILLQLLLGGAAGLAIVGKLYWHKFLGLIGAGGHAAKDKQVTEERREDGDDGSRR
jgi:hypothetical protein